MDLKEIKSIIDLMTRNGLSEFELEKGEVKLRIKRGPNGEWATSAVPASAAPIYQALPAAAPAPSSGVGTPAPAKTEATEPQAQIVSPMVGTFYRSPSPDSGSYVEPGQEVNPETVVCIIEAMKVMNEIKAEMKGVIVEVLAQNGKPVEFGKPLFSIRPS